MVLRLRLVGRDWFLAFWYNPHALQMVSPAGDRRHSGVFVVPQLLAQLSANIREYSRQGLHGGKGGGGGRDAPADLARNESIRRARSGLREGSGGRWHRGLLRLLTLSHRARILERVVDFGCMCGWRSGLLGLRRRGCPRSAVVVSLVQLAELFGHFYIFSTGLPGEVVRMGWSRSQRGASAT